ncbi:hypothetical protein ACU4GI_05690 [Cupriavidus basilensis]
MLGKHRHETSLFRRGARPGFQVGHAQAIDRAAFAQQAFAQGFARKHQRQADPYHGGKGQHERRRQQPLALRRRR